MNDRQRLLAILGVNNYDRPRPVSLSDGTTTSRYLDVKGVLCTSSRLRIAGRALQEHLTMMELPPYRAIGGPTMGADVVAHALVARCVDLAWFSVRSSVKSYGLGRRIEGFELQRGHKVVLTDDVADTGKSLLDAYKAVVATGAQVVAVVPLVDRTGRAGALFSGLAAYRPLLTHNDFLMHPIRAVDTSAAVQ